MSYEEYDTLFKKAQKSGDLKIYSYDMVNSKKCTDKNRNTYLLDLITLVYKKIELLEKIEKKQILYKSEEFAKFIKKQNLYFLDKNITNVCMIEPFLIGGDQIGFTVLRNMISDELVDYLFELSKKELNINYEFHKTYGFYETDNWFEGNIKYYRGYLIQKLSNFHKKEKSK